MSDGSDTMGWSRAVWLAEVHSWIAHQLHRMGAAQSGEITQPHVRPWATALRVPTNRGCVWFKATMAGLVHESAITQALSQWIPGRTPDVLAADTDRNWLLMADGGERMRALCQAAGDTGLARTLHRDYAALQQALVRRVPQMLALRTPDCRLAGFPALYLDLLCRTDMLGIGEEEGLTREELARLHALAPRVEAICAELAEFGIPETLQHDDLHWNNVLVRDGRLTIFDWGDSSVSHPFLSLVVLLRGAARDLDVAVESAPIQDLRAVYLKEWNLRLSPAEMDRACLLADALGRISRALTWRRVVEGIREPHRSEYIASVPGWLQEFLESPALGEIDT